MQDHSKGTVLPKNDELILKSLGRIEAGQPVLASILAHELGKLADLCEQVSRGEHDDAALGRPAYVAVCPMVPELVFKPR